MATRLFQLAIRYLLAAVLLGGAWAASAVSAHAEGIEIRHAQLEADDDGYRLSTSFAFDLNRSLEDALNRGIPLYFTTDVDVRRPRWYWLDEHTLAASQSVRLSYNVLTRQYHVAIGGSNLHQGFASLEDALSMIRRPARWLVADKSAFKPGNTYEVAVRMRLDIAQLPKPFQVTALNNSDWRLSSDWKIFNFKVE